MSIDEQGDDGPEESFYMEYLRLVAEKGDKAVDESLEAIKKIYGSVPLVARVLAEDKDYFLANIVKNRSILHRERGPLDPKTMELVVISAATALHCEHCLEVHMKQAIKCGATREEILQTIMASSAIAESASRATAFRKFRQVFAKIDGDLAREGGEDK